MKVVLLAGGLGTRLTEETETRPKPMVEIGGRPILWHIMKLYAHFGFREFVVALGYKGDVIKRYFLDYAKLQSDFSVNLGSGDVMRRSGQPEDWTVHLVDTGSATNTGGRLKRLASILGRETFMATYGDGVSNVDINALVQFHRRHGKLVTTTAVRPPARFGGLVFEGDRIVEFTEKPQIGEGWINGGFFVMEPQALEYIADDTTSWEREPLEAHRRRGEPDGLSARSLLAMYGYAPRPQAPGRPLDRRESPLESLGDLTGVPDRPGSPRRVPATDTEATPSIRR